MVKHFQPWMKHWAACGLLKHLILKNYCGIDFFKVNEEFLTAKNKIGYRRDLASPLSEVLGVIAFYCCIILWRTAGIKK